MTSDSDDIADMFDSGAPPSGDADSETRYVCSSCSAEFPVGQKIRFCSNCGAKVDTVSDTVVIDTSATPRVLLVDDSTTARKRIRAILEILHCEVTEAPDGASALALIGELCPQLIVLDIHMPNMTGLQVLEALRRNAQFADVPIVMMTGEAKAEIVSQAIALKATDYIRKDDAVKTIASRLQTHLAKLDAS